MFGLVKKAIKKVKRQLELRSWHYDEHMGAVIRCVTTPCGLHGDDDIMAVDKDEAEKIYFSSPAYKKRVQEIQEEEEAAIQRLSTLRGGTRRF